VTEKLYPIDYDATKAEAPATKPGWEAAPAKDTDAALALIRAAVPKGGEPLSPDQLVDLVCGRYVPNTTDGNLLPMEAAPDASVDLPSALAALKAGQPLKGPAACASFIPDEIKILVAQVADERRATWKLAAVEAKVEGEEKPR
jgi:hypothetical protein